MQEIDKRIGLLRLLLADVDGRIQQQQEISGQYRVQIARIVDAVVRQAGDVGHSNSLHNLVRAGPRGRQHQPLSDNVGIRRR